ncbi:hypothetical protein D3C81_1874830 [compost metagenome]
MPSLITFLPSPWTVSVLLRMVQMMCSGLVRILSVSLRWRGVVSFQAAQVLPLNFW